MRRNEALKKRTPRNPSYQEVRRCLTDVDYFDTPEFKALQGVSVIRGVAPDLIVFARRFLKKMKRMGIPMYVHRAMRTYTDHVQDYVKGDTNVRPYDSPYLCGCALDIRHGYLGRYYFEELQATERAKEIIGAVGNEIIVQSKLPINWGGSDWAEHWEIDQWDQTKIRIACNPALLAKYGV